MAASPFGNSDSRFSHLGTCRPWKCTILRSNQRPPRCQRSTSTLRRHRYGAIGVAACEHLSCWRKDRLFCLRKAAPNLCYRCPKCGNRDVIRRGTFNRVVHVRKWNVTYDHDLVVTLFKCDFQMTSRVLRQTRDYLRCACCIGQIVFECDSHR